MLSLSFNKVKGLGIWYIMVVCGGC